MLGSQTAVDCLLGRTQAESGMRGPMIAGGGGANAAQSLMSAWSAGTAIFGVTGALVPEARRRSAHAILP